MQEHELEILLNIKPEPSKNVYRIESKKDLYELERIMNVFKLYKNQTFKHKIFSITTLVSLNALDSNN